MDVEALLQARSGPLLIPFRRGEVFRVRRETLRHGMIEVGVTLRYVHKRAA
jgi:hypothetical protein